MARLRVAARSLLRAPWFTLGAALTFALGVGINLAVFASVDRLLFRPLPYAHPDRMFLLTQIDRETGERAPWIPARYVLEARARLDFIEESAMLGDSAGYFVSSDLVGPEIRLSNVTVRMLDVGGVRTILGRGFTDDDGTSGVRVAILTYEAWQSRYGGAPDALGRRIHFQGGSMPIVGVLAPGYIPSGGFVDPAVAGLTNMQEVRRAVDGDVLTLPPTVRLSEGISHAVAEARLNAMARAVDEEAGITFETPVALRLIPVREAMFGQYDAYLLLVMGGAALVLLIASANLAGLFLVRGQSRLWEAAVRMSLGGSSRRLLADAVLETGLVCLAGVTVALGVLALGQRSLEAMLPPIFAKFSVGVDLRVAVVALVAATLAALTAAVVPLLVLRRIDPVKVLQRTPTRQAVRMRPGRWLLAAEAALGVVLVAGAVVTTRSFTTLSSADLGFEREDLYLLNVRPPTDFDAGERRRFMLDVMDEFSSRRDVESVASAPQLPILRTGESAFGPDGPPCCRWRVTADYFGTAGVPVLAGRTFEEPDFAEGAGVAIVNRRAAQRLWPGVDPGDVPGRLIRFEGEPASRVVGVVGDTRRSLDEALWPALYLPLRADASLMLVRTRPGRVVTYADLRPAVEGRGGSLLYTLAASTMYGRVLQAPRFRARLFSAFAGVALLVAMVGLYAAAGFEAANRQRELGLRLALGASRSGVLRLVVLDVCRPVLLGALAGVGIVLWAAGFLESFLFEVDARAPGPLTFVVILFVATAVLAAWLAARRAAGTDPAKVLRAG